MNVGEERVLVGKPEEKSQLGGRRRRREDNIKMDFRSRMRRAGVRCSGSG